MISVVDVSKSFISIRVTGK